MAWVSIWPYKKQMVSWHNKITKNRNTIALANKTMHQPLSTVNSTTEFSLLFRKEYKRLQHLRSGNSKGGKAFCNTQNEKIKTSSIQTMKRQKQQAMYREWLRNLSQYYNLISKNFYSPGSNVFFFTKSFQLEEKPQVFSNRQR